MSEVNDQIASLEARLDQLVKTQVDFQKDILAIRAELTRLKLGPRTAGVQQQTPPTPLEQHTRTPVSPKVTSGSLPDTGINFGSYTKESSRNDTTEPKIDSFAKHTETTKKDLEKFIGENLISKIGILILIIGVGIGVKYSIDNELISPTTRVILAYIFAFGLTGLAIKLRSKYHNFSAALMSGGMAIMYFVTYFANAYYGLIPQLPTFALMVMFTVLTVAAALVYNRQVIAHIGLVGAYAVPFLLSQNSGNYLALFGYMAVVNTGTLAISIYRTWKPLFYTASFFTWAIFTTWAVGRYEPKEHFSLMLVFLGVFFALFFTSRFLFGNSDIGTETEDGGETTKTATTENLVLTVITTAIFYAFCLGTLMSSASVSQTWITFSYIAVSSVVLLLSSIKSFGRPMMYLIIVSGWIIYWVWFNERFAADVHLYVAAVFAVVIFAAHHVTIFAYRLSTDDLDLIESSTLILANSFIFYGFGYAILNVSGGSEFLGLYTVGHAAFHLGTAYLINRSKPSANDVVYVLVILILTFTLIAVPIQFNGNAVTMIWAIEAALLFWIGRTRKISLFEYFSLPVMTLAAGSMLFDWAITYENRFLFSSGPDITYAVFANADFITAIVVAAAFAVIFFIHRTDPETSPLHERYHGLFGLAVGSFGLFVLYNMFRMEIGNYFFIQKISLIEDTFRSVSIENNFFSNVVWQINYTLLFLILTAAINLKKFRSSVLAFANSGLIIITVGILCTAGLFSFFILCTNYVAGIGTVENIWVRYASYALAAGAIYAIFSYHKSPILDPFLRSDLRSYVIDTLTFGSGFLLSGAELMLLMHQFHIPNSSKLGLSILWGLYALFLIGLGIVWKKKHLRIAAIALLAVTLVKLFFYDMANLDTIPKTILFVILGITLLVISFLYNKYKQVIFGATETKEEI